MSPPSGSRFDWAATVLAAAFTGGLFLDGWAHAHGHVDQSFFTPWHAVLYSAFTALGVLLVGRAAWDVAHHGVSWRLAIPDGYGLALAGAGCWVVGGPLDAVWHSLFGAELELEALLSPAHGVLAFGIGLMVSGPLRAVLRRPADGWLSELPMILSLAMLVSVLTFFTQMAHPMANLLAERGAPVLPPEVELGITGIMFTTAIVTAPLLLLLRYDRLPVGATTIVVGLNAFAMGFLYHRGPYPHREVLATVGAALLADLLRACLRPAPSRPLAFRTFAWAVPVVVTGTYFTSLGLTSGIAWTLHLWLGSVFFAGTTGWLVSYLALPPRLEPGS